MIDLHLHDLFPLTEIQFSGPLSAIFSHIDLKFGICICLDVKQIKFVFAALELLLYESLSFDKIQFSILFYVIVSDIDLKFGICLDVILIKLEFCCA